MLLEKNNVKLRAMEPDDVQYLYTFENDTSLWSVSDNISPFSREGFRLFIKSSLADVPSDQLRLMIDFENKTIGCIDLFDMSRVNHHASIGILVYDKSSRKRGVASTALQLLEEFAYKSLELITLKAEVSADNTCAMNFFNRMGYRDTGILQKWKRIECGLYSDVHIFQHNISD